MKKIVSLLVLLVAFASCEEDIKFNNPAVQALKNDELWRATTFSAKKSGNSVIIIAQNDVETLTMTINAPAPNSVHDLGINDLNAATFELDVDGIKETYKTGTDFGNGKIVIRGEVDNNINGTDGKGFISGNFYFNAYNADETKVVNFQKGVFYKVPVTVEP